MLCGESDGHLRCQRRPNRRDDADALALGFESFYVPEHVTLYPGARVGEVEFAPDLPIADPVECLAFVAASSTTILLGTGVLLLPFHHPVPLTKRLATIDVLSSGRMRLLTIGVSSLPGEAAAVGVEGEICQPQPDKERIAGAVGRIAGILDGVGRLGASVEAFHQLALWLGSARAGLLQLLG